MRGIRDNFVVGWRARAGCSQNLERKARRLPLEAFEVTLQVSGRLKAREDK